MQSQNQNCSSRHVNLVQLISDCAVVYQVIQIYKVVFTLHYPCERSILYLKVSFKGKFEFQRYVQLYFLIILSTSNKQELNPSTSSFSQYVCIDCLLFWKNVPFKRQLLAEPK